MRASMRSAAKIFTESHPSLLEPARATRPPPYRPTTKVASDATMVDGAVPRSGKSGPGRSGHRRLDRRSAAQTRSAATGSGQDRGTALQGGPTTLLPEALADQREGCSSEVRRTRSDSRGSGVDHVASPQHHGATPHHPGGKGSGCKSLALGSWLSRQTLDRGL